MQKHLLNLTLCSPVRCMATIVLSIIITMHPQLIMSKISKHQSSF